MVSERARNRGGREERNDKDRKNKVILTEQNDGVERIIPTTAFCNRKIEKKNLIPIPDDTICKLSLSLTFKIFCSLKRNKN